MYKNRSTQEIKKNTMLVPMCENVPTDLNIQNLSKIFFPKYHHTFHIDSNFAELALLQNIE